MLSVSARGTPVIFSLLDLQKLSVEFKDFLCCWFASLYVYSDRTPLLIMSIATVIHVQKDFKLHASPI